MSVELPETKILADQMAAVLPGKTVKSVDTADTQNLQRTGFMHSDLRAYQALVGRTVRGIAYRGMTIVVELDKALNLVIGLDYGGEVLYHPTDAPERTKFHLWLGFADGSLLTIRIRSMGAVLVFESDRLDSSYMYKRDFGHSLSALEPEFTLDRFSSELSRGSRRMKTLLVGKEAIVVGFANAGYQEILFRAGIHPMRKGSELKEHEIRALYESIRLTVQDRIAQGGKEQFADLYGKAGSYQLPMGSHVANGRCPRCNTRIMSATIGGGKTFFCPSCQK